jgi:anti-anti-sigma factor
MNGDRTPGEEEIDMQVSVRFSGTTAILDVRGGLTIEASVDRLHQKVRQLRSRGVDRFVLNLVDVDRWDCSGIGELVRLYVEMQATGARLRLCNVGRRPGCLLDLFQLSRVLGVYGAEQEAVASFGRRRRVEIDWTARTRVPFQAEVPRRVTARARLDSRGRLAPRAQLSP